MSAITIKFHGLQEEILTRIMDAGVAETKSEAIRMALLKFAVDLNLIDQKMMLRAIQKDLSRDKRTPQKIIKEMERAKHGSVS